MGRPRNPVKFTLVDPGTDEVRKRILRELVGIQITQDNDRAWDFYACLIDQLKDVIPDGKSYLHEICVEAAKIKPFIPGMRELMNSMIKTTSNEKEI